MGGLPGGVVPTQRARRGRVLQKKMAILSAVSEVLNAVSQTCETAAPMATPALVRPSTAKPIRTLLEVDDGAFTVHHGPDTLLIVGRTSRKEVARFKARKPEGPRKIV